MSDLLGWRVGAIDVVRVEERVTPVPPAQLVPELTNEEIDRARRWADPFVTGSGLLLLSVHTFVIRCGECVIVVDTCAGTEPERPLRGDPTFPDRLGDAIDGGLEAVDVVLCTHLHFDHVGWNTVADPAVEGGRRPLFPRARYLFDHRELAAADEDVLGPAIQPLLDAGLIDLIEADEEHVIVDDPAGRVRTIPTPGHTPGHVSVLVESGDDRALITGDVFHSPLQIAHTDRFAAFDEDRERATETRRRIVEETIDDDVLVLGTHFPPPTAGHIRTGSDGAVEFVG